MQARHQPGPGNGVRLFSGTALAAVAAVLLMVVAPPATAKVCDGVQVPCDIGDTGPGPRPQGPPRYVDSDWPSGLATHPQDHFGVRGVQRGSQASC
jgi:hypothetical protein